MNERDLFDRAAREMRPEFRARLHDLIELAATEPEAADKSEQEIPWSRELVIEVAPEQREAPRWVAGWLFVAAAAVVVILGVALLVRDDTGVTVVGAPATPATTTPVHCVMLAPENDTPVVDPLADGSFCVGVLGTSTIVGANNDGIVPDDPVLVESGSIANTDVHYYVFAIPQRLPVNVVNDEFGRRADTTVSESGRRVLIVESGVDTLGPDVTRTWTLSTDGADSFGTISATGPLPLSEATQSGGSLP